VLVFVAILDRFLVAFLAVWMLLTIGYQLLLLAAFAKLRPFSRLNWDPLALIPRWIFWASPPAREWQVLYRNKYADGRLTPWTTAWRMRSNPFRWIWNPDVRTWKAIDDCCFSLLGRAAKGGKQPNELFVTWPYIALAAYISGIQPSSPGEFRQFMVAKACRSDDEEPAQILFVSPLFLVGTRL